MKPQKKFAGVRLESGVQLMYQIYYDWPSYNHSRRSTKVKTNQVNKVN